MWYNFCMTVGCIAIVAAIVLGILVFKKKKKGLMPHFLAAIALIFGTALISGPNPNPPEDSASTPSPSVSQAGDRTLPSESPESDDPTDEPTISLPIADPSPSEDPEDGTIESGSHTLPCGMKLNFADQVRNDKTGKWRRSVTASSLVPADYALEYYDNMFSSDEEIHAVCNLSLNTTTRFIVQNGMLFVDTLEYVDGEEHDAIKMFSGKLLTSRIFDLDTREEIIDDEPTQAPESDPSEEPSVEPSPVQPSEPIVEPSPVQIPSPSVEPSIPVTIRGRDANTIVYVSNSSDTIHSVHDCSGMKHYREMTIGAADAQGFKYCTNCW